jgi:hypothetical protein
LQPFDLYFLGVLASLCVLAGPVAIIWCLILRRRFNDLLIRYEQLASNYRHLSLERMNVPNTPKPELITLESPGNTPQNSGIKKPVPVVPFAEIDSCWQHESVIRQRKKFESGTFSASAIRSAVFNPELQHSIGEPRNTSSAVHPPKTLRLSVWYWFIPATLVWGVTIAELYWYGIIGTDTLYLNGIVFLILACLAFAATVL